jgi:hypothetical protein
MSYDWQNRSAPQGTMAATAAPSTKISLANVAFPWLATAIAGRSVYKIIERGNMVTIRTHGCQQPWLRSKANAALIGSMFALWGAKQLGNDL